MPSAHAVEKQRIRRHIREWRSQLAPPDRTRWSAAICDHLRGFAPFLHAHCPAMFWAMPTEVDLAPLADARCIWPEVVGRGLPLRFRRGTPMHPGPYGILQPDKDAPEVNVDLVDLILFPGMAFDEAGHRLGHGAGFYDRTFAHVAALRVGVCFGAQVIQRVPVDEWDLPMHFLVTEEGVRRGTALAPATMAAHLRA